MSSKPQNTKSENKGKQRIKVEDLEQPVEELNPEEAAKVKGGQSLGAAVKTGFDEKVYGKGGGGSSDSGVTLTHEDVHAT
jgi:hypothetical protein